LKITEDERGTVSYCHRCGYVEVDNHAVPSSYVAPPKTYRPWVETACYLWEQSEPIAGSVVERYLERRGCRLPPEGADLRYLPARDSFPAAMLARVTDAATSEPISLHFTRLNDDATKVAETPKKLLSGHRKIGGCIRLWPDDAVTTGLALTEGIESALAAAHAITPIWAAIDAGNLGAFPVLDGIEALTLIADNDKAGIEAADRCARTWLAVGREVRIALPQPAGSDACDLVAA
jgi:hypothetical protein